MSELVQKLSGQEHRAELAIRPVLSAETLRDCLKRGYVHIRFPDTRGGTELGIPVNAEQSDLSAANFDEQSGTVRIVGNLVIDYVPVTCTVKIDLATLQGTGRIEVRQ